MDHQQQPLMVHPPQLPSREESHRRAIIHIDIDSFYAQVEVLLDPSLRGRPVGVQQKYLMVTCNYVARAAGVKKMQSVTGALQACPELIVKNGETLTKYREASERVQALLLGADVAPCVERLNLDECWLDVTAAADADAAAAPASNATTFAGHLYTPTASSTSSGHEFSDGTGDHDGGSSREGGGGGGSNSSSSGAAAECICGCVPRLAAASRIAARLRAILAAELGMTCCAGVGSSKMVAKLAAELHRPNDQSAILPQHAAAYVARVPLKKLPGCGHTTRTRLEPLLPPSPCAADLLGVPWEALVSALQEEGLGGGGAAQRLWLAAHGADPSPVSASGRPKSISQEDSYRKGLVTSMDHVKRELQKLTPDVLQRVQTRLREHGEAPSALRVGVRTRAAPRRTRQCRLPIGLLLAHDQARAQAKVLRLTHLLLERLDLPPPLDVSLVSVGVADFQPVPPTSLLDPAQLEGSSNAVAASSPTAAAISAPVSSSSAAAGPSAAGSAAAAAAAVPVAAAPMAALTPVLPRFQEVAVAARDVRWCGDCGACVAALDLDSHAAWHVAWSS